MSDHEVTNMESNEEKEDKQIEIGEVISQEYINTEGDEQLQNVHAGIKRPHSEIENYENPHDDNSTPVENLEQVQNQEETSRNDNVKHIENPVLKNGCCRNCMKAFSKNNKSCLCQVPKDLRRTQLPSTGCKFCNCHGCNPADFKKKNNYWKDKFVSNRRLYSDNENDFIDLQNEYDRWHMNKQQFAAYLSALLNLPDLNVIGFGFPRRSPSYLGL